MSKKPKSSNTGEQSNNNIWNKILNGILFVAITLFVIWFVIPSVLAIIAAAFPESEIDTAVLDTIKNKFDSVVGIMSLLTGIISIILSKISSKSLEVQKSAQDEFLRKIDDKTSKLIEDIDHLREDNNHFYDSVTNML